MTKAWNSRYNSLRRWRLANFKSVEEAELPLAPLTLVVGANSAGKSSFLQSILLVAQASMDSSEGDFPLNGMLLQLGAFEQAKSDFADSSSTLQIEAELALGLESSSRMRFESGGDFMLDRRDPSVDSGQKSQPELNVSIQLAKNDKRSSAVLEASDFVAARGEVTLARVSTIRGEQPEAAAQLIEGDVQSIRRDTLGSSHQVRESITDPRGRPNARLRRNRLHQMGLVDGSIESDGETLSRVAQANAFRAGLPVVGSALVTKTQRALADSLPLLDMRVTRAARGSRGAIVNDFMGVESYVEELDHEQAAELLIDKLGPAITAQLEMGTPASRGMVEDLIPEDPIQAAMAFEVLQRDDFAQKVLPKIVSHFEGETPRGRVLAETQPSLAGVFIEAWLEYLRDGVHYLGPLREDPKAFYPHGVSSSSHMPLGRKGESTAATLLQDRQGQRRLNYPCPRGRSAGTLGAALKQWVREFGLAEDVQWEDEGRFGIGLTVDSRDLTSVGTGVSQILPVLVMCLQARPGDLVLLEQPELHLNPGLQQRLADFFLAMVRSGRQIIVETHSEYLVTRLRRRVVEDEAGQTQQLFTLLFAKQDGGKTQFDVVDTRSDGSFDFTSWPQGFFDQAGDDVEAILLAVASRRSGATT